MSVENNNPAGEAGELAEIDWLAFAYVAGELDGRELEEWTSRLADGDVEACEAVAVAVELVQSMSNTPYLLPRARWGYRMGHAELVDGTQAEVDARRREVRTQVMEGDKQLLETLCQRGALRPSTRILCWTIICVLKK